MKDVLSPTSIADHSPITDEVGLQSVPAVTGGGVTFGPSCAVSEMSVGHVGAHVPVASIAVDCLFVLLRVVPSEMVSWLPFTTYRPAKFVSVVT